MTRSALAAGIVALALLGCGESPVEPESLDIEGFWQLTEAGISESTFRFADDGTFVRVEADLVRRSCLSSSGRWREEEGSLTLEITVSDNMPTSTSQTYSVTLDASGLGLTTASFTGLYGDVTTMPSCVDYGFGAWSGAFSAEIDGEDVLFAVVDVELDIDAGTTTIRGEDVGCTSCPDGVREILLRIESQPDPLDPRTFSVNNDPGASDTFYALYHPDPASSTFSGFDTTRLAPPGTFVLSSVGPERIAGSFGFRANPRVEGDVGPNGETFAMAESGVVALTYR